MLYQGFKNKAFSRYNKLIVLLFVFIVFSALSVALYYYSSELARHEKKTLLALVEHAERLNSMLEQSEQTIKGMQSFANYYLAFPEELSAQMPKLAQDGALFYLDKPRQDVIGLRKNLSGNITGLGEITDFKRQKIEEIAMANALTPAFISAKMALPQATWFYYVSLNQFINIYPWIDRANWHYRDKTLNKDYIKKIALSGEHSTASFWSSPYLDSAGAGLSSSLSIGVYRQQQLAGAVVIDINLNNLDNSLPEISSERQGLVLLDKQNNVLVYKHSGKTKLTPEVSWRDVLPEALAAASIDSLLQGADSEEIEGWLLQKHKLAINDWTLLVYQRSEDFSAPVFKRICINFVIALSCFIAFFGLLFLLTRQTFSKPTAEFISHIEHCSQGDPGKIKPTADWLHWFKIVEDIFSQNRSLLQQLKEQNTELDLRVSEKTQALMKSSEQHQRDYALLDSVMNAMPELIIFNDPQGQLIGCNKAFEEFINKDKNTMLGLQISQHMPLVLGKVLTELSALSSKTDKSANQENYNQEKVALSYQRVVESAEHTYEVFSSQFHNDSGISLGTINIFRDVTEQYAVQLALKSAKNQAEYANQAKSQFLANMSHEIRTPINAMQGMMALLSLTKLSSHQSHYLDNAQRASTSLLHLIDELLDLSKIEAGKMFISKELANLDLIVDRALKLNVGIADSRDLQLIVDISPDVPQWLMTDEMRLVQVLTNLLNNAAKFTHQGEIKLSLELTAKSETSVLVRFTVKDTGIGIAKEKQRYLFDAFSQADDSMTREYGGSGLGLSICQQIVNLLGGEITLQSELGQGCEFSFVLPFSLPKLDHEKKDLLAKKSAVPIVVCLWAFDISELLIKAIELYGWEYCFIDSLTDMRRIEKNKQIVLLAEGTYLISKIDGLLNQEKELQQQIILLGVCQPASVNVSADIAGKFALLAMPYILLDLPLYRYSMSEIAHCLASKKESLVDFSSKVLADKSVKTPTSNLNNVKILLVEDNLVNQLVAKELLLNMQAEVTIAENGQDAIEFLMQSNETKPFDVILMDIQMPVMDGLTATRLIRAQDKYAHLPIIAMTAHARAEDKSNSFAAGMNLHIAKPISAELLLQSILSVLD